MLTRMGHAPLTVVLRFRHEEYVSVRKSLEDEAPEFYDDYAMAPSSVRQVCADKSRLMSEIADAIKLMISYHNAELESVIKGEASSFQESAYQKARELKVSFQQQLRKHLAEHGC